MHELSVWVYVLLSSGDAIYHFLYAAESAESALHENAGTFLNITVKL